MAKKQKTIEVEEPIVQEITVEPTKTQLEELNVKEKPLPTPKDTWEIKDRNYYLSIDASPLSYSIKSADIYYFDEEKGYERELKYTSNQKTPFVDEFPKESQARLEHIVFRNGKLNVPKNKQTLQKLLSLYHPHNGVLFMEHNPVKKAETQI